jgi:DNA-directed RNA polymerase specialized sigma subunit
VLGGFLVDAEQTRLVTENVGLANFLARLMWERAKEVLDRDELQSLAYQGLVSSALRWRSYGEENGYSKESIDSGKFFSVFARRRILGQIMDAMRDADHVQRSVRTAHKAVLKAGFGQGRDIEEISVETGYSISKIHEVLRAVENSPISMDSTTGDHDEGGHAFEAVNAVDDVESSAVVGTITDSMLRAYATLPELQQCIVVMRFYLQMELQLIAAELGMGLTPVRELMGEAVLSMHAAMFTAAHDALE